MDAFELYVNEMTRRDIYLIEQLIQAVEFKNGLHPVMLQEAKELAARLESDRASQIVDN